MTAPARPQLVFKILTSNAWRDATERGHVMVSPDDARDGFVHLSTADQIAGTLAKHYAGQSGLVLVAYDAATLGDGLRWEPSRGGDIFPHLYGPLPTSMALWAAPIDTGVDGRHILPTKVAAC